MPNISQIPFGNDIVRTEPGPDGTTRYLVTNEWVDWLLVFLDELLTGVRRLVATLLTAQTASIGTTPLASGLASGTYFRVSYVAQVEQAATVSSTLTVIVSYVANAFTVQEASPAMVSNSPNLPQSGSFVICSDDANFSFSTIWGSVGATPMRYRLAIIAEAIPS